MTRPRWLPAALAVCLAIGAVAVISLTWKNRADEICREDAPAAAADPSVVWEWNELAYVCDYGVPTEQPKRIGVIDAFHGDDRRRHR